MDHKEQHHQKHKMEREHEKKEHKKHEQQRKDPPPSIPHGWPLSGPCWFWRPS
jgi:hypothetical protein